MGEPFVGLVHPCKLYNILRVGAPMLYIGPTPSHVTEIMDRCSGWPHAQVPQGQVEKLVREILRLKWETVGHDRLRPFPLASEFSKQTLLPRLIDLLEPTAFHPRATGPLQRSKDLAIDG